MRYIFDRFEFNDRNGRLSCDDAPVHVRPKLIALLQHLIRQRGRVVSRQELLSHVWPDVRVGGTSLSTLLNEARTLLGDSGDQQNLIRTEPGQGYCFIAQVEVWPDATTGRSASGGPAEPAWLGDTRVHDQFDRTLEDLPRGGVRHLLIRGEPGSGKSHLAGDLLRMTAQRGIACFKAHCPRPPEGLPLAPWLEILSSLQNPNRQPDSRPSWPPDARHPDPDSRVHGPPQMEEEAAAGGPRAVASICHRLRTWAAERGPALILIEDLHWADRASLLALERLTLGLTHEPLLLVATVRPREATGPRWRQALLERIHDLHCVDTFELAPLGRETVIRALTRASGIGYRRALKSTLRRGRSAIQNGDLRKAAHCLETALEICAAVPDGPDRHARWLR